MNKETKKAFETMFKHAPQAAYFSPGRVNLIGEHTDYSGGYVFPMALSLGIMGLIRKREDAKLRIYSSNFSTLGILEIDMDDLSYKHGFSFGNYIQGVLQILKKEGYPNRCGLDVYLYSTLPASAGLSSSAALEMLMIEILADVNDFNLSQIDKVKLAQRVENDYMHVSSGIMDQYAVQFGRKDYALFLNTHTLKHHYAPIDFKHVKLILMNTNKTRNLEESAYNDRFSSVKKGSDILKIHHDFTVLGQLELKTFESLKRHLSNEKLMRRLRHVVSENARTKKAYKALKDDDLKTFGSLMVASHHSLKDDFEVSCAELDFLVQANLDMGALGARMTGAGFGGTMIALYDQADLPDSFESLKIHYQKRFNKPLDIYTASSSDGAKKL